MIIFFFSWELVGLCSYLLISFWKVNQHSNLSSIKAVLYNKLGDIFLLLAIGCSFDLLYFAYFDFMFLLLGVFNLVLEYYNNPINILCCCLIIAAFTKSTKIPFSGWMTDAMAAPTPVSALLHAATMVTAGIFLLFRFWFIIISNTICSIGGFTSLFGSIVAVFQSHMKKIIAYSTTSQLGYLCWSCGLSNYFGATFHLFGHAFFKSLLFLTAGVVLHSNINEVYVYKLGGFTTVLVTSYTFIFVCSISLIGLPSISGYYSKEYILSSSYYVWFDLFLL